MAGVQRRRGRQPPVLRQEARASPQLQVPSSRDPRPRAQASAIRRGGVLLPAMLQGLRR